MAENHMAATLGRVQEIKQKEGGRRGGVNINRHCKDPQDLAWDHAVSLLSLYVSHGKRAWYISLSDHM